MAEMVNPVVQDGESGMAYENVTILLRGILLKRSDRSSSKGPAFATLLICSMLRLGSAGRI